MQTGCHSTWSALFLSLCCIGVTLTLLAGKGACILWQSISELCYDILSLLYVERCGQIRRHDLQVTTLLCDKREAIACDSEDTQANLTAKGFCVQLSAKL